MKTSHLAAILTAAALALPAPAHAQSAGQAVCSALDVFRTFNMGIPGTSAIFNVAPSCTPANPPPARYYVGSGPAATNPNDLLPLVALPFVTTGAYLCGVADSHGTSASASAGVLGIETRFNVTERSGATVKGERVGTISLFGASAVLERQDFSLTTSVENVPGGFGNYMEMSSSGIDRWDWTPSPLKIRIPAGPGTADLTLGVRLHGRSPNQTRGNWQLIANPPDPRFRYSEWERCLAGPPTCTSVGNISICSRPCDPKYQSVDEFRLDRFNPCPGICDTMGDGMLPYAGAFGGASGFSANYINFQPFLNWFHLGRPGFDPTQLADQPAANLDTNDFLSLDNNATTYGRLNIDVAYSIPLATIALKTTTTLAVRDGFAMRHKDQPPPVDTRGPNVVGWSSTVDAESAVDVDADVTVDINLLPFDPPPVRVVVPDIIKNDVPSPSVRGVTMLYPATQPSALTAYTVRGVPKPQPDQARLQCQFTPTPVTRASTPISNPGEFLRQVARNSVDQIHPCNVTYCANGSNRVCNWNSNTKKLDCTTTSPCVTCRNTMQLCGANGAVLPRSTITFGTNNVPQCIQ
jgi:hypothetical protein